MQKIDLIFNNLINKDKFVPPPQYDVASPPALRKIYIRHKKWPCPLRFLPKKAPKSLILNQQCTTLQKTFLY